MDELANQIRAHYRADGPRAETLIESYLEERLEECSLEEKLALLEELRNTFGPSQPRRRVLNMSRNLRFLQAFFL